MTPEYRLQPAIHPGTMSNGRKTPTWVTIIISLVILPYLTPALAGSPGQPEHGGTETCPENLSRLHKEMESLLRLVDVPEFIRTMRESLTASIPEAIQHTDGLEAQIVALQEEIQYQERVERSAELIARDVSHNQSGPLEPCRRRQKGGYCSTVERYYMAKAANLANRGFLAALQCYQEEGKR